MDYIELAKPKNSLGFFFLLRINPGKARKKASQIKLCQPQAHALFLDSKLRAGYNTNKIIGRTMTGFAK